MSKARPITPEELKEFQKLVNTANHRIQRLEKLSKQKGYGDVLDYAYRLAQTDIKERGGTTRRYSSKAPLDRRELNARINEIKKFMSKPSSTKGGILKVYGKRAKTLSTKIGVSLKWQDIAKVFETGLYEHLSDNYGKYTAFDMIGQIEKQRNKLTEQISEGEKITFSGEYSRRLNADDKLDPILEEYLKSR